jgi:hypothetical protein
MSQLQKCESFKVGDLVRALGVPDVVGLIVEVHIVRYSLSDRELCWLKVLWSDLGHPPNWERGAWIRHAE